MNLCGIHLFYLTNEEIFIGHASNTKFMMCFEVQKMCSPFLTFRTFRGLWPDWHLLDPRMVMMFSHFMSLAIYHLLSFNHT